MREIAELRAQLERQGAEKARAVADKGHSKTKPLAPVEPARASAADKTVLQRPAAAGAKAPAQAPVAPAAKPPAAEAAKAPEPPPPGPKPAPAEKPAEAPKPTPAAAKAVAPPVAPQPPEPKPAAAGAGLIREVVVTVKGAGADSRVTLSEPGAHEVGRVGSAAVRVNHPTVSRRHARLVLAPNRSRLVVEDAGSANPTKLNGVPVGKPAELKDGDVLDVGAVKLEIAIKRG
jgi:outer membrane biosynthesis protein TonB